MIELWMQRDAVELVTRTLKRRTDLGDAVVHEVPDGWTPRKGPIVTVVSDGTPVSEKSWTRELVRVTVHAHDRFAARRILVKLDALLLTPGLYLGANIKPGPGIIAMNTSKLEGGMASAGYRVTQTRKVETHGS
ncbi:hypothetical protein [Corynebacterium pygosceleis]|uniref:DUF3168 domain-containing protein n=1 Tax=Corynebacterium pygosceleis TaxID=2800406 RepID=A0ABT3WUI2_9CORY|nr:hypothetical protein [Corynebacterium pygosceleis]MCK7676368.1 hypothetical protein [Corynebacterium pygosceleis]MCX7445821.1 hypothetical protein [Corynebacterium pygosceleis]